MRRYCSLPIRAGPGKFSGNVNGKKNASSRTYNVATTAIGLVADLMVFGKPPRSFGTVGRLGAQPVAPVAGWPNDMLVQRMTPYRGGVLALLKDLQTGNVRLVFDAPLLGADMRLQSQLRDIPVPEGTAPLDFDSSEQSVAILTRHATDGLQVWQKADQALADAWENQDR